VRGATIRFAGRSVRTNRRGRATMVRSLRSAGRLSGRASKRGLRLATTDVRILPAACSGRRAQRSRGCRPRLGSAGVARGDFNGDGFADLAVGTPSEDLEVGGQRLQDAGQVSIIYGSSTGLVDTGNELFNENSLGRAIGAEAGDRFGDALAAGDFDSDGRSDLAIGVPGEDFGGRVDIGAVAVLYGSSSGGLSASRNQLFTQDTLGVLDLSEAGDSFGDSLVWGDFGKGPQGDLAIGAPLEDTGVTNSGGVNVLYGSSTGLTATGNQFFRQTGSGDAASEAGDTFGAALGAGNLGRSPQADLAVGIPLENRGSFVDVGATRVLYGSTDGLTTTGEQFLFQPGTITEFDQNDRFGSVFAAGDFDADGPLDLAVGVPTEDAGGDDNAGQVNVLYGSSSGISSRNQVFTQDSSGVSGDTEGDDRFGGALAAGNFGKGARADLAIGSPGEDLRTSGTFGEPTAVEVSNVGSIAVLYGVTGGLTGSGSQSFTEDSDGVPGSERGGDNFGAALTAWNFGASGELDLAVGVPGENVDDRGDAGSVNVLYGSFTDGLRGPGSQRWTQNSPGILDNAEGGDQFGFALY
jgi:hypothetical protein